MSALNSPLTEAIRLHQTGRLAEAEKLYRQILAVKPHPDALHLMGVLAYQREQNAAAKTWVEHAIAVEPNAADYHNSLGLIQERLGDVAAAITSFERAVKLRREFAEAHNNLGNALHRAGRIEAAEAALRAALTARPNYAEAHTNLGNVLSAQGRTAEALAALREGARLAPRSAQAHFNLGIGLRHSGAIGEALAAQATALGADPNFHASRLEYGILLHAAGRSSEAVAELGRLLQAQPQFADAHYNLALIRHDQGDFAGAARALRQTIALRPNDVAALNQLSIVARALDSLDEAIALAQRAIAIAPQHGEAHNTLGNALKEAGDLESALAHYRLAFESPRPPRSAYSNFLLALHYRAGISAAELGREHRRWAEQQVKPLPPSPRPYENSRDPERRLRVGYLSPDLRDHPVARFLLPLWQHHDRTQFEVHAFSAVARPDETTRALRSHVDAWHDVAQLDEVALAEIVRREKIDVLVDLAAHAAGSRLLVFGLRPAPVQVTYLAYCSTTGLEAMDYRISDPHLDPPETDLTAYTEKTIRLPRTYWCYAAPSLAPEVSPLPAMRSDFFTFGCLNNYAKVGSTVLQLWTEVLSAVPRSRLILHTPRGAHRTRIEALFAAAGISHQRLQFVDRVPLADFFRLHHEIDVALDPFPFNGGTTTCDALWMGVPVISLSGDTAVSRAGRSLLTNVGLPHLAVSTRADYVRTAAALAADLPALAELRGRLRQRMAASPLMDAPAFARDMIAAFRTMWRSRCTRAG